MNQIQTQMSLLFIMALMAACAPQKKVAVVDEAAIAQMSAGLKSVQEEYLPESISDTGSSASMKASTKTEDICAGVDFMECQPRLIRAYVMMGQEAVALTHKVVTGVARDLYQAPDNSSGSVHIEEKNLTIEYNKRSLLDYDFLIKQGTSPVGRVSANPNLYTIQFDVGILEAGQPDSRGGKIDIQVKYQNQDEW